MDELEFLKNLEVQRKEPLEIRIYDFAGNEIIIGELKKRSLKVSVIDDINIEIKNDLELIAGNYSSYEDLSNRFRELHDILYGSVSREHKADELFREYIKNFYSEESKSHIIHSNLHIVNSLDNLHFVCTNRINHDIFPFYNESFLKRFIELLEKEKVSFFRNDLILDKDGIYKLAC